MKVLAIDPGTRESGWVMGNPLDLKCPVVSFGKWANESVYSHVFDGLWTEIDEVVIEKFVPYGRRVGQDSVDTVFFSGRMYEAVNYAYGSPPILVPRRDVSRWMCDIVNAKDADIRQALIDRYGPGRDVAVGVKHRPGPLYGVQKDVWLALALALTYVDRIAERGRRKRGRA